jgi:alpha-mannosidase
MTVTDMYLTRIEKFMTRMADKVLTESVPFQASYFWSKKPVAFADRLKSTFIPIREGEIWGGTWESAWFHLTAKVPKKWKGRKIVAHLDFEGEGLVVMPDGTPLQGITHRSIFDKDFSRTYVHLYERAEGGEAVDLWVEAAGNSLFGVFLDADPDAKDPQRFGSYQGKVTAMRLCTFDEALWHFLLDMQILSGLVKTLPEKCVRRARIIRALTESLNVFASSSGDTQKSREILKEALTQPATASDLRVTAVGHAHIDTGWLWPVQETIRKCIRTFASQIRLLEKYPHYVFGASQPQHYQFVKEYAPQLYDKIKKFVAEGRWELQGGMWVEADCNLISGESMIRQFIYGKNFYKDEFNFEVENLWLPDVFGYSAAMPQILKQCNISYFLSQKLSWSQFNEFPHHTFRWRGIDGTEILTHFPPENTYNSQLSSKFLVPGRDNFKEKDFIDEFICLFGIGDGGGGPKEENIEYGLRLADLEGAPKVRFGRADRFFENLAQYKDQVATWVGELYLELHRGTLTSQALVKRANRKLEFMLRQTELLWSSLPLEQYPQKELEKIWKKVLINQFHDIIPGSSINAVYKVTHAEYRQAMQEAGKLINAAAEKLFLKDKQSLVLFNSLSYSFKGSVSLPEGWSGAVDKNGEELPVQKEEQQYLIYVEMPAHSYRTLTRSESRIHEGPGEKDLVLENELIRYEFSDSGVLTKILDKEANRQVLEADGYGNLLSLYHDRPNEWDAWDIDLFYEAEMIQQAFCVEIKKHAQGAVRQGLRSKFKIGDSEICQDIYLTAHKKRLDFITKVEWKEQHRMLRVAFPVAIQSAQASFDIQYGYIRRETHRNTSWERAKFEVVGHRYADLSAREYGVALLNDCKYGYKVKDNVLDLNLLRSPRNPDPDADQGAHEFTYSLLPHLGDLIRSDVMSEAAQLNQPVSLFSGFEMSRDVYPVSLEGDGLSLEVVKKAEKENCLIIRIVETKGLHSSGVLDIRTSGRRLVETNLIEWEEGEIIDATARLGITLRPFEIRTYKVKSV